MESQKRNIYIAVAAFALIVIAVGAIGFFMHGPADDIVQGEIEVGEYRVSSKLASRVLEIRVREGDYVHAGDTLAILDAPEVEAKRKQAESAESAASALDEMTKKGAREEQIRAAKAVLDQAKAGLEVAEKSYRRVQRLFDEGVMTAQKRDEALANYKVLEAQVKAAESQYDMAVRGARQEEKMAAQAQVERAKGAVQEVNSYVNETVQVAKMDGEISTIYPKVGELIGAGSPIMTVSLLDDIWGTFNIREDKLQGLSVGSEIEATVTAFKKPLKLKIYHIKDKGQYAAWKATKATGEYDLKTFEIKARPVNAFDGLRPGMTLILKR